MIKENILDIKEKIKSLSAGLPQSVRLIAVSKKHPALSIVDAFAAGQVDFGENFLQECLEKQEQLALKGINKKIIWHYIGSIQSNKAKKIAENFSWIHTISSIKVAKIISKQRSVIGSSINICLQINIDDERTKSGLKIDDDLLVIAKEIDGLENIKLRGLMCIPSPDNSREKQAQSFMRLRETLEQLNKAGLKLDTLSMGMSSDIDLAIKEGSTMVRVGTAIFGDRKYD